MWEYTRDKRFAVVALLSGLCILSTHVNAEPHRPGEHADMNRSEPGVAWETADARLKSQFREAYDAADDTRVVFDTYLDVLGFEAMLDFLELNFSHCHSQAHELGKALYSRSGNLTESLMLCADGCTNACMHGVVADAFGDRDYDDVISQMDDFCIEGEMVRRHKPGNCAHAIGHALMLLTEYDLARALSGCVQFSTPGMDYYCATGVFMEYHDASETRSALDDTKESGSAFFPCDVYGLYPAACYRYMLGKIGNELHLNLPQLIDVCAGMTGSQRLGCFHGLGARYLHLVAEDPALMTALCQHGGPRDQIMCIEGVIEKLADYDEPAAVTACNTLTDENRQLCLAGAHEKMYRLDKPTMYLYRQ